MAPARKLHDAFIQEYCLEGAAGLVKAAKNKLGIKISQRCAVYNLDKLGLYNPRPYHRHHHPPEPEQFETKPPAPVPFVHDYVNGSKADVTGPNVPSGQPTSYACLRVQEAATIITPEDLAKAMVSNADFKGISFEAAHPLAKHVVGFFGYGNRIIDNVLEPEDRDPFYMLEDAGLMTTEREETTLYDGREWRIHYWLFRLDRIGILIEKYDNKVIQKDEGEVYKNDGMWTAIREIQESSEQPAAET